MNLLNAPVAVWIHGGGYREGWGSEPEFDAQEWAARDVILVSINYRLGIFGFMAHPELSAESPYGVSGNYGMNKPYALLPDPVNQSLKKLSVLPNAEMTVTYKGVGRVKEGTFLFSDFLVKGAKAGGVTLTKKEIASIRIKPCKLVPDGRKPEGEGAPEEAEDTVELTEEEAPKEIPVKAEPKPAKKAGADDMPGLFDDVD